MPVLEMPVGSKEYMIVDVRDRLGNIDTLDGVPITFRVLDDEGGERLSWTVGVNGNPSDPDQKMKAMCLIDTTSWTPDEYDLFVKLDVGVESPILGPFRFVVG